MYLINLRFIMFLLGIMVMYNLTYIVMLSYILLGMFCATNVMCDGIS